MPSVMQSVGTPNARHNLDLEYRKHLENVDRKLSEYNEVIRRCSVDQIYAEHLQASFDRFNEKQKRKDRRLDVKWGVSTFLEYQRELDKAARQSSNSIDQKGRPPIREIIWQFGNPEQGYGCNNQTPERRREIIDMLRECQEEAERRFPQFAWGDVVAHADEVSFDAEGKEHGSIHLHSSFVPICHQNKQGPDKQVAFERCLREMGYATFEAWKHELDSIMEDVLQRHGLERTFMENDNEHQNATEYHRQQKLLAQSKEYEKEAAAAQVEAETAKEEATQLRNEVNKLKEQAKEGRATVNSIIDRTRVVRQENLEAYSALQKTKAELDDRQAELDELQVFIDAGQGVVSEYDMRIEELQGEHSEAEIGLQNKREELQSAAQDLLNAYQELRETREDLGTIKGDIDDLRREKEGLKAEIGTLATEKEALTEEVSIIREVVKRENRSGEKRMGKAEWERSIEEGRQYRALENKVKKLETTVSLYERFFSTFPEILQRFQTWLAEQYQNIKKKTEKKHDEHDR